MAITLQHSTDAAITLPEDLIWEDEFGWSPVATLKTITLAGALIVEASAQQAGRPITLAGAEDAAWIDRATLESLRGEAANAGREYTLTLNDDSEHTVQFDQSGNAGPIEAHPVIAFSTPDDADWYVVKLKFFEVA